MKSKVLINSLSAIGLIGVLLLSISFAYKNNNMPAFQEELPELLNRSEKIQNGKEWDGVQNSYMKNTQAFTKNNQDFKAGLTLAQIFIQEARVTGEHGHYYPAALSILDQILKNSEIDVNSNFQALVIKAGVQLSLHEFEDALKTGMSALQINERNAQVYGVLVDANVELGNYRKAVEYADKMISIKPDVRSYSRISYLREIHGDVEGAIEAMMMGVKSGYPGTESTAWAMLTLGELYQKYDMPEKAKAVYDEILVTRDNYPFAVGALGDLLYNQNDLSAAEIKIQEAMDIIPEVGFYIQMAQIFKDQNREEEFDKISKEILVMLKEDTDSGHNMNLEYANLYLNLLDDHDKALEYAKLENSKRPENIDTNLLLAEIYTARGNKTMALNHLTKAEVTKIKYPRLQSLNQSLKS